MSDNPVSFMKGFTEGAESIYKALTSDPDPHSPKCCFCFPMKCGIIALGVFALLDTIELASDAFYIIKISTLVGIFFVCGLFCMIANLFYFIRYFHRDSFLTRSGLAKGCLLMVAANTICYVAIVAGAILDKDVPHAHIWQMIPTYGFPVVMWAYYRFVCL